MTQASTEKSNPELASKRVHFVSLGCPKNRVDAEHMFALAEHGGHVIVDDPSQADAIVVNTCAFIGEAKEESIETILEMGELKKEGGQQLIVSGCLAQRYVGELESEMPEVDHFLGTSDYRSIGAILGGANIATLERPSNLQSESDFVALESLTKRNWVTDDLQYVAGCDLPRKNSMPKYTAYLKVAEGCDNKCAFCIIPKLRGKQRSRPIEDLVREAHRLAQEGVKELNLIAQDLTGYGHDLPGKPKLHDLLNALQEVNGLRWVRCMYAYPRTLTPEFISLLNEGKHMLPYLDIPVQHGSDRMLKRMKRGRDQKKLTELLLGVRAGVKNLVLRSTVIVGFPGEQDDDFQMLVDFAEAVKFERLGVFRYSDEEDTSAFDLDEKLPDEIKVERYDELMEIQRDIHADKLKDLVGQVHEAIVCGQSEEHEYLITGRLWSQAPEIDGITYLSSTRPLSVGEIVYVRVTETHDYDVVAEVLEDDDEAVAGALPFRARGQH